MLLFVGAEYGSRKIAKSSRKVKFNVITRLSGHPKTCGSGLGRDEALTFNIKGV
jgi:hypothetical protein